MYNPHSPLIPSPCFLLDEKRLRKNLELLKYVQEKAGVDIILAFKGFAMWSTFPMVKKYLAGATASSLHEAMLCFEEMGSKAHTYAAVYLPDELEEIMKRSSHLTFNSLSQYDRHHVEVEHFPEKISCGLRVNPEYSEVETELYNPCAPGTRLGVLAEQLGERLPEGIEGLHFHALCESKSYDLEKTLAAFEKRFGPYLSQVKWVNMGGGHLITHKDYDPEHLIQLLLDFRKRHPHLKVILEPGSAVAWETGDLITTVLDIVENNGIRTAMIDASFTAHMPDTLEMPYRPAIVGATDPLAGKPTYRIGGISCLAGDYLTEYSFAEELRVGDRLILKDMIHYTMVKTSTFNGVKHPSIAIWTEEDRLQLIRTFGYEDFKNRLS